MEVLLQGRHQWAVRAQVELGGLLLVVVVVRRAGGRREGA